MAINDSNKTDQFDNEQAQLVHNDVAYQGATETTQAAANTILTNGTQKTQITDGANSPAIQNVNPLNTTLGLVVRPIPYEPATFSIVGIAVTLANLKHLVSIMNNNGSGQVVKIKSIKIINNQTTGVTGVATDMRAFRITSLSAGTAISPQAYDLNDTLSGSINVSTGGTVGGLATNPLFRRVYSSDEWGPGTADVESGDHINQSLTPAWTEGTHQKPIVIRAGQGLTIQCVTNTTAGTFDFEIVFTTENA